MRLTQPLIFEFTSIKDPMTEFIFTCFLMYVFFYFESISLLISITNGLVSTNSLFL